MSDDEIVVAEPGDSLARVYDYFKHLTTVSLITIGGIFGLIQGDGPKLKPVLALLILGVIGLAGGISMLCTSVVTAIELRGAVTDKMRRDLARIQLFVTSLLMFGIGIFVSAFSSILK
jgi:hypothetical protein